MSIPSCILPILFLLVLGTSQHAYHDRITLKKLIEIAVSKSFSWNDEHFLLCTNRWGQINNDRFSLYSAIIAAIALNRTLILPSFLIKGRRDLLDNIYGFQWESSTNIMTLHNSFRGNLRILNSSSYHACPNINFVIEFEKYGPHPPLYDGLHPNIKYKNTPYITIPEHVKLYSFDDTGQFHANAIRLLSSFQDKCLGVNHFLGMVPSYDYITHPPVLQPIWNMVMKALAPIESLQSSVISYMKNHIKTTPFWSVHVRLGDFCEKFTGRCDHIGDSYMQYLKKMSVLPQCGNITNIYLMTNDFTHPLINIIKQTYNVYTYTHPYNLPIISGVRSVDQVFIEIGIASYARCFLGDRESTMSYEIFTRRMVDRNMNENTSFFVV